MAWKVAVVGLGIMGRRMIEHMGRHEAFAPTLLWDPSAEACAKAAGIAPAARIAGSASEAIAGADVVYLACPPAPRKALALEAAAAGKAVFLEKPLGVDVAESRDLVARLEAAGAKAAVNFTQAAGAALARVLEDEAMGASLGADIIVTYPAWPRAWQREADWLRFAAEGGYTREVISHFLFFAARCLGPLWLEWARLTYPADPALCETHIAARLVSEAGAPVSVFGSVGGAQPDRQEVTIKGARRSWRISDFYLSAVSDGGPFDAVQKPLDDPRAPALRAQLDHLDLMMKGAPHRLATLREALAVQELVEAMLARA